MAKEALEGGQKYALEYGSAWKEDCVHLLWYNPKKPKSGLKITSQLMANIDTASIPLGYVGV